MGAPRLPRLTKTPTPTHTPAAAHAGQAPLRSQQETRTSGGACGTSPSTASRRPEPAAVLAGPAPAQPAGTGVATAGHWVLLAVATNGTAQPWNQPRPRGAGVGGWLPRPAQQRRARPWTNLGSTTAGCRRGGLAPTACTTNQPPLPQTWPTGPDRRWRLTSEVRAHTHHSKPAIGYRPTGSRLGGCARCVVVLFRHLCFIS